MRADTAPDAPVHYAVEGRVAVLTIDHPPVNALGHAVRAELLEHGAELGHVEAGHASARAAGLVGIGGDTEAEGQVPAHGRGWRDEGLDIVQSETGKIGRAHV